MTNKTMTLVLLRKKLLPTLEYLRYTLLQDASLREDEDEKPVERFFEIVTEALHWQLHATNSKGHVAKKFVEHLSLGVRCPRNQPEGSAAA